MDGDWCKASVHGTRNSKGWGMNKGHPGFIPDADGGIVNGLVFASNDLPANWARLDEFEGVDYKRVSIKATLENGDVIETQIYSAV